MDELIKRKERELDKLAVEDEIATKRVSLAQKRALEKSARAQYGRDWKKVLGLVGKVKVNKDTMQTMHGLGLGGDELREMSKPPKMRYR